MPGLKRRTRWGWTDANLRSADIPELQDEPETTEAADSDKLTHALRMPKVILVCGQEAD